MKKRINENQKITLTLGQLKKLIKEHIGGSDEELAQGMAKDLIDAAKIFDHYDYDLSDKDDLQDFADDFIDTDTIPTRTNINLSNGNTGAIWEIWEPGCRYNVSYPAFDEALKAKTGIDYQAYLNDHDEEDFYTFENCNLIYKVLNPLYKRAKEIFINKIIEDPELLND